MSLPRDDDEAGWMTAATMQKMRGAGRGRRALALLAGAVLAGGGAFGTVYTGLFDPFALISRDFGTPGRPALPPGWQEPAYVALEPIVFSLGPDSRARHLRVVLTIEVTPGTEAAVTKVVPRVRDVLNTFLRAVDERDFELPQAMMRLRAQMLRRVQLVAPEGAVRDLLIQEFLLS